jgi:hypothetical protein
MSRLVLSLLSGGSPAYSTWIQVYDPDNSWMGPNLEGSLIKGDLKRKVLVITSSFTERLLELVKYTAYPTCMESSSAGEAVTM